MANLSLCKLFGLSFARTDKNGDLIATRVEKKTSVPIVVKVPSGRQSKWLLGKPFLAKIPILDTEPSLHVQELLAPPEYTHHGQLPGQTEIRWTWFQTVPFPEVLAPSLHQAKSCKKEC